MDWDRNFIPSKILIILKEKIMANIARRSPLASDVTRFDPFFNVDDWFDWVRNTGMRPFSMEMENAPTIKMDLTENDTAYTVRAEIPGVKKEDVKVQIDGNRVSISAETRQERSRRKGKGSFAANAGKARHTAALP